MSASPIQSRIPYDDYRAAPALNISALKELRRSPLHFQYALTHPKDTPAMRLGTAAHCATLEPERFARDFAVWTRRTDSGRIAPRNGKVWEAFVAEQGGRTILTDSESTEALAISAAVRGDPIAAKYLATGEPEVVITATLCGRPCKGRADWITRLDTDVLVGLKSARNCTPYVFGSAAAKLGYHLQWAFYFDLYVQATGRQPRMVEIVVENTAPYAVVVYVIPDDVIDQGRDEYMALVDILERCERENFWPGPAETEQILSLPSWVYGTDEDLSELGLEAA
jgi:hypothetical protein